MKFSINIKIVDNRCITNLIIMIRKQYVEINVKIFSKLIKSRYNADDENNILALIFKDFELENAMLLLIILDIMLHYTGVLL